MDHRRTDPLGLQLGDAEQTLRQSLAAVCAERPSSRANTGELIRVAEVLEIAGTAVKHALAIRRRRRVDEALRNERGAMADAEAIVARNTARRTFTDSRRIVWDVFDVYVTVRSVTSIRLTPAFQRGWLCFESVDEKRRLGPIPAGWRSLSDDGLERLLRQAEVVPIPRRRISRPTDASPPSA